MQLKTNARLLCLYVQYGSGIAKSQKRFDSAEVSVTACNHGCQNADPEQPGAREGEVESWMGHLVWPNQFKPMPLLPQKSRSCSTLPLFGKVLETCRGLLLIRAGFRKTSRNTINGKLQGNSHTHTDMHTVCSSAHVYIILLHSCII